MLYVRLFLVCFVCSLLIDLRFSNLFILFVPNLLVFVCLFFSFICRICGGGVSFLCCMHCLLAICLLFLFPCVSLSLSFRCLLLLAFVAFLTALAYSCHFHRFRFYLFRRLFVSFLSIPSVSFVFFLFVAAVFFLLPLSCSLMCRCILFLSVFSAVSSLIPVEQ